MIERGVKDVLGRVTLPDEAASLSAYLGAVLPVCRPGEQERARRLLRLHPFPGT